MREELQRLLDKAVAEQKIPGAVVCLITPDGCTELASGVSNQSTGRPMQVRDRFRIASVSKMFVATVVLQLVDEEEIDLDETLTDWLPESITGHLPNSDAITIRQLLNHTSGLDDYLDTEAFDAAAENSSPGQIYTAQEAIRCVYDLDPLSEPGEEHNYSNTNYVLLEMIVEEATSNPLYKEIRQRILQPLKLKDTYSETREKIPGGFVEGYEDLDDDGIQDATSRLDFGAGLGDGCLISTAYDVAQFTRALLEDEQLLESDTLEEMTDWVDDGEDGYYGLGLCGWDTDWGESWGHDGCIEGFLSTVWHLPDEEVTLAVLTNEGDRSSPDDIAYEILSAVLDE